MAKHDYPDCRCGLVSYSWSDRETWVDPDDLDAVADVVVNCALDHSYDRGCVVPHDFRNPLREKLIDVVSRHLTAIRPDWTEHTVDMNEEQRSAFHAEVRATIAEARR